MGCPSWLTDMASLRRAQYAFLLVTTIAVLVTFTVLSFYGEGKASQHKSRLLPLPLVVSQTGKSRHDHRDHPLSQDEIAARFEKRRHMLQEACRQYGNSSAFRPHSLQTWPILRYPPVMNLTVGYCFIRKVSSLTWQGILKAIGQEMTRRNVTGVKVNTPMSERDVLFMFVREPYSRLLSAYVDKIFLPDPYFWERFGRYIVKNFRSDPSEHSLRCGHDVTFPEFIKYFIHMQTTGEHRNPHYIPFHDLCEMCEHPYKYIGHLETMKEDMPFILKAIQSPITYDIEYESSSIGFSSRKALSAKNRGRLTKCLSSDEASRRLWKQWQIRGIVHKSQDFPLTKKETKNFKPSKLYQAASAALGRSGPRSERVGQKQEAMREAFASVPLEDRLQVQRLLFLDFQMFGFDPQPDEVFPQTPFTPDPNFSYFDLYKP